MTLSFIYLLIAALLQLGWLYNMKRIKKEIWKKLKTKPLFTAKKFELVLPLILYLVFGILNVVFLTWSMDKIPPSIAYAVWTGIVIAAAAIIDQIVLKKPMRPAKIIFILMILIGVVGLKLSTP
jgi:quaternary ammonium compound-resistance protein SugE